MPKSFEGWVAVVPESKGWGTDTFSEGHYLFCDSESLSVGQEFKDRPDKIVFGRAEKPNSRSLAAQKPNGNVEFQFRSNDVVPILMAHFQKFIGSNLGAGSLGTADYTFVPEKGQPDTVGSSWGTGSYTSPAGDLFTVGIVKKLFDTTAGTDNAMWFKNCIVDQLAFSLEADNDAKITASIRAKTVDVGTELASTLNPPNTTFGSYSEITAFESWEGTLSVGGRTDLKITSLNFTSINNAEDRPVIGDINPTSYDFGRYMLTGVVQIDAPKEALRYVGSMVADHTLAITGTLWNSANSYVVFNMPGLKYEPFDINLAGGDSQTEFGLAFKAFESQNGNTEPISVRVRTTNMGSAFTVV